MIEGIEFYSWTDPTTGDVIDKAEITFSQEIVTDSRELKQHKSIVENLRLELKKQLYHQVRDLVAKWAISNDAVMIVPRR